MNDIFKLKLYFFKISDDKEGVENKDWNIIYKILFCCGGFFVDLEEGFGCWLSLVFLKLFRCRKCWVFWICGISFLESFVLGLDFLNDILYVLYNSCILFLLYIEVWNICFCWLIIVWRRWCKFRLLVEVFFSIVILFEIKLFFFFCDFFAMDFSFFEVEIFFKIYVNIY